MEGAFLELILFPALSAGEGIFRIIYFVPLYLREGEAGVQNSDGNSFFFISYLFFIFSVKHPNNTQILIVRFLFRDRSFTSARGGSG